MRRRWPLFALAGAALVLVAGRSIASLHADQLWFDAIGASGVWRTRTLYGGLAGVLSMLLAGGFIFVNLYAVRRSIVSLILPRRVANLEIGEEVPGRYLMAAVIGLAAIFGLMLDLPEDTWMSIALVSGGVPFRETDPYYRADLGFFVYWLPFETSVYLWALITVLVASALVLFLYALTPSLRWERGTLHVSAYVRRHLAVLAGVLLVLLAWSYRLDAFHLLIDGSGPDGEFLQSDHKVRMLVSAILAFVTIAAALVVIWGGWVGQLPLVFTAVTIVLVLSFVLRQIVPALGVGEARGGDPAAVEQPYLETRAAYTRRAFGVDRILTVDGSIGYRSWTESAHGMPTWDLPVVARVLGWSQGRTAGPSPPSMRMSSRGVLASALFPSVDTTEERSGDRWVITTARATRVDGRGSAVRVDRLGFPSADDESIVGVVSAPGAGGYRLVDDSLGRIPAPRLGSLGSRLAHAWSLQNFALLSSDGLGRHASIVTRRDVRTRVDALTPFFAQGASVTPILAGDSLYWVVELYSSSASYPLSAPIDVASESRKYFRHAATAIVGATTGAVRILAADDPDPIAASWMRRFPSLFVAIADLPREVVELLPPVEDGALAQAKVFAEYGRRGERAPRGSLAWQPTTDSLTGTGTSTRLVLPLFAPAPTGIQPVLDATEHVRGMIVAAGGANRATLWMPTDPSARRWTQLIDRLHEADDTTAAPVDGQWERGAIRAFPVAGSIALVQTTYSARATNPPAVARVAVLVGDSLAMGPTLSHALGVAVEPNETAPVSPQDFRVRVNALYAAMLSAMQRGDWGAFGEAFEALGAILEAPRPLAPPPVRR